MPSLSLQVKLARALREMVLGDPRYALPTGADAKPDFLSLKKPVMLPRSTPEAEGLPSTLLDSFFRHVAALPGANVHALMVLRHGKVVAEAAFTPFRQDIWHVSHSLCKTFTGTAVGLAVGDGLFSLEDTVGELFPEAKRASKRHKAITVHQLLTMRSGLAFGEIHQLAQPDWIKGILGYPLAFAPGEEFQYNSMNSYLLSVLVCRKSGMGLLDYLKLKLFGPMGFGDIAWEKSAEGFEKGGWGMYLLPEDMAKFGQLYLQKGQWEVGGQTVQLLPLGWAENATKYHSTSNRDLGYGYHCWVDANGNFTMNGMFGQYITVFPSHGIVVAMTSGNPYVFANTESYQTLCRFFSDDDTWPEALPPAPASWAKLNTTLSSLRFRHPPVLPHAPQPRRRRRATRAQRWACAIKDIKQDALPQGIDAFCGTTWYFEKSHAGLLPVIPSSMTNNFSSGVKAVHLRLNGNHLMMLWEEEPGTLAIPVGFAAPLESRQQIGKENYVIAASAALRLNEDGEDVLLLEIALLEHSSLRKIKLRRQGENVVMRLGEEPDVMNALGSVAKLDSAATGDSKIAAILGDLLLNNDYNRFRIEQFCAPRLLGRPVRRQR